MNKNIGILHLSDFHINETNKDDIERLLGLMYEDIDKLLSGSNTELSIVCITGDLINKGQNHHVELEMALSTIIMPIIEHFSLNESDIFIVPGNHEVDITKIDKYSESGLSSTLTTAAEIDAFVRSPDLPALERLAHFREYLKLFPREFIQENELYSSFITEKQGVKLGLALVNSAWRSSGRGRAEKNAMIIGQRQMTDCLNNINSADIKIGLMHHPLDWLLDVDKFNIEKAVNGFDIVLNGHIHALDSKSYNSFNGQTLFNTAGKFDLSSDIFNGYALLSINPQNYHCDVHLRHYHPHPRNCYDIAVHLSENGILSADLGVKDESQAIAYNAVLSIRDSFFEFSNSFFVSNVVDGIASKSFDELFIAPTLSRFSEYEKETKLEKDEYLLDNSVDKDDGVVTVEQICGIDKNVFLYGKKEIGKTTLLHYFAKSYLANFAEYNKVPIVIDSMKLDAAGNRSVQKAISSFISEYARDDFSISTEQIALLLDDGKFVIMLDNFEGASPKQTAVINDFAKIYAQNRFIFSCMDSIRTPLDSPNVISECEYIPVYIRSMSKHQIRTMAENWQPVPHNTDTSLVDKTMLCFKNTSLPKTPFVVSLILSICKDNLEFIPVNEAVVMESFIEMLLEKGNIVEAQRSTYDFRNKEDFLIYLVSFMHTENRYCMSNQDFERLLYDYHEEKKFDIYDTKFDKLFFEKGILIRTTDFITFRYSCIIEYYLAKKAINDTNFLNYILADERFLNYTRELALYTGLKREDMTVLNAIRPSILQYINDNKQYLGLLEDYRIDIDISVTTDILNEKLTKTRYSVEESDRITDDSDTSEQSMPEKISKTIDHDDYDKFLTALLLYGTFIKNSELLSGDLKKAMFAEYITGLMIWLGKMKEMTEERAEALIEYLLSLKPSEDELEESIGRIVHLAKNIIKISLPVMIQNVALENIGTVKLKTIMKAFIDESRNHSFEKFVSLFSLADLRVKGAMKQISDFVNEVENKDLLKIMFFKLLYYYQYRYFAAVHDHSLESMLADIVIKLQNGNKFHKDATIKGLRNDRESMQDTWDEI